MSTHEGCFTGETASEFLFGDLVKWPVGNQTGDVQRALVPYSFCFKSFAMPSPNTSSTHGRWGEMSRAAATVLLLVYLTGLTLTVIGNTSSGSALLVSVVKGRLFSPWMTPAWLDLGFDYFFTYAQPTDAALRLEVRPHGDAHWQSAPGTGATGLRAVRWQRLLRAMLVSEAEPGREGLLPAAVGAGLFDRCDSEDVDLQVLVVPQPDRQAPVAAAGPAVLYAARVRRVAGGEVQLIRTEARREVAPVVPTAGGTQ